MICAALLGCKQTLTIFSPFEIFFAKFMFKTNIIFFHDFLTNWLSKAVKSKEVRLNVNKLSRFLRLFFVYRYRRKYGSLKKSAILLRRNLDKPSQIPEFFKGIWKFINNWIIFQILKTEGRIYHKSGLCQIGSVFGYPDFVNSPDFQRQEPIWTRRNNRWLKAKYFPDLNRGIRFSTFRINFVNVKCRGKFCHLVQFVYHTQFVHFLQL